MIRVIKYLMLILVIATGCKHDEDLAPQDEIIKIEPETLIIGLSANGVGVITLKVTIPEDAKEEFKLVTFLVSDAKAGTFTGANADNVKIKAVNGIARTNFKLGTVPGTYYISAQISSGDVVYKANQIQLDLSAVAASDILTLTSENLLPIADDKTTFKILVASKYPFEKKVKLTCNIGTFVNTAAAKEATVDLDDQGKGSVSYRISNDVAPHVLSASFTQGAGATLRIDPAVSYPETLVLEGATGVLDTTGKAMTFNAFLKKAANNGKVSTGRAVQFEAYQMINGNKINVGRFNGLSNAFSAIDGSVPIVSFFGDTGDINTKLPVTVEVKTAKNETQNLNATLSLKAK